MTPKAINNVTVAAGETVQVVFNVEPGYIEGTVTLIGATISSGGVTADTKETPVNSSGFALTRFSKSGTFRFPCFPAAAKNVTVQCTLQTTGGTTFYGTAQYPDVVAGQTTICNWEFNAAGSIAGKVDIPDVPFTYSYVAANGPSSSSARTSTASDGTYQFTELCEGSWSLYAQQGFSSNQVVDGVTCRRSETYRTQKKQVQLAAGESVTGVDFVFVPGFFTSRVLHPNSAALPLLYWTYAHYRKYNPAPPTLDDSEMITENYAQSPASDPRPDFANLTWAFVSPGTWQMTSARLYFASNTASGLQFLSDISVADNYPFKQVYNLPPMTVAENETVEYNADYKTGLIRVRLLVSDGRPLSSPSVKGSYLSNNSGFKDRTVNLEGSANAQNVVEGLVQLFALPGVYQLSAKAIVEGSTTSFGPPFNVTIDTGDVVEKDPEAPDVTISFPPGEYLTCEESVEVTGTVTDASGVAIFSINGQAVALDEQGNFTFLATGLTVGNNTLHFEAIDIYDKTTTVDRIVIRNGIPVAHDDAYSLYDDQVLSLAAPGVLANDTDADHDALSVTGLTDPASGMLAMSPDGAFTYTPVQGAGGLFPFTYTIQDGKCGSSTATVTIQVMVRNQPPVAKCKNVTVSAGADCMAAASIDDGSFDPDAGDTITVVQSPAGPYQLGDTSVTLTVTDSHGVSTSCAATVTVMDTTPPSITAPAAVEVGTDPGVCEASNVNLGEAVASDNCSPVTIVNDAPAVFPKGVTLVTWTATDSAGNPATATQTVTVNDTENPTIIAPPDVFIASDADDCSVATTVALGQPTTADNCEVASVSNDHPAATFPLGETLVTWTVTDTSGLTATAVQKVTVLKSVTLPVQPPLAPEPVANKIRRGQVVPHKVVVTDCSGALQTSGVTVLLKVQGIDNADNTVFQDVIEEATGQGNDGTVTSEGIMQLVGGAFHFNLDTSNFSDPNTLDSPRFYRSTITVIDNATLTVLGTMSAILETRE